MADYYHVENGKARIDPSLLKNIIFSSLNLATDRVFTEVHLVLCRNVLIYFDNTLQNRVLNLLHDSLVHGGILCLGSRETIRFSQVENHFLPISGKWRIFQKRVTNTRLLSSVDRREKLERRERVDRRDVEEDSQITALPKRSFKVAVIGCSSGGRLALRMILNTLPENLPIAIVVVQHIAADTDAEYLTTYLDNNSLLNVVEASDKERIKPGTVYVAPPGFHLMVEANSTLSLSNDPKINYSRPSIDVLFESAAVAYRDQVIGLLLTGANSDGSKGLGKIMEFGGVTIVQDYKTAESPHMPRSAIEAGVAGRVLPLAGISTELCLMLGCELP